MIGKKGLIMTLVGVGIGLSMWLFWELAYDIFKLIGVDLFEGSAIAVFFQGILSMIGFALCVRALFLPKFNKVLVFSLGFLGLLLNGAILCMFVLIYILW